jgi:hypothetical protein
VVYPNVHLHFHRSHLLRSFLSQLKLINTLTRHICNIYYNNILPSHFKWSVRLGLPYNIVDLFLTSYSCYKFQTAHPPWFDLTKISDTTFNTYLIFLGNCIYPGFSFSFYVQIFPSLARYTDKVQHRTGVIWHYLLVWPPLIVGNRYIASPVYT